jgi:hypothetical protein
MRYLKEMSWHLHIEVLIDVRAISGIISKYTEQKLIAAQLVKIFRPYNGIGLPIIVLGPPSDPVQSQMNMIHVATSFHLSD